MKYLPHIVSSIGAGLLLSACASTALQGYEGRPRPDTETVLISVQRTSGDRGATTIRITSIESPRGEPILVTTTSVRLLPREMCVGVVARTSTLDTMAADLCFEGFAGSHYEVLAVVSGSPLPTQLMTTSDFPSVIAQPESGPYDVDRLLMVDVATRAIVADTERQ